VGGMQPLQPSTDASPSLGANSAEAALADASLSAAANI